MPDVIRIWGPGSLSNLGPGFDTLGVAIEGIGDIVEVAGTSQPGVQVLRGGGVWRAPDDPMANTAGRAAMHVLNEHPGRFNGVSIRVIKGIRPGSGLGSSAASASAAALGTLMLLTDLGKAGAVEAALEGESLVSGARHGDNVLPALMGGAVLTSSSDPAWFRLLEIPVVVHLAVVRPEVEILTRQARAMLPKVVPLRDAVHNASSLAFLVDSLRSGDIESFARCIEQDRLVEPVRARLVPGYDAILGSAREAGALGAALSGSGPALFAVCADETGAGRVKDAMVETVRHHGLKVAGITTRIDLEGARITEWATPPDLI